MRCDTRSVSPSASGFGVCKVLFFISALRGGGAERVLLTILKRLDRKRFEPHLLLFRREGDLLGEVPGDVPVYELGITGHELSRELLPMVSRYREITHSIAPQAVVSFLWEPNIVALMGRGGSPGGYRVAVSERINLSSKLDAMCGRNRMKRMACIFLTQWLYRRADRIIAVCGGVADDLFRMGVRNAATSFIYNPVDIAGIEARMDEPADYARPYIMFAGRLTRQKNIPLLLRAFRAVRDEFGLDLLILGTGEEEASLRAMAMEMGIAESVRFAGYEPNPYRYMARARAFVLPSDFEGFPNVLVEAMACLTPVISTDCPSGPSEIIEHGRTGMLVRMGDAEGMAGALRMVLGDSGLRAELVRNARASVERFSAPEILRQYESMIESLCRDGEKG